MRGLFVSLVVLNLIIAGWLGFGFQSDNDVEVAGEILDVRFNNLVLSGFDPGYDSVGNKNDALSCLELGMFGDLDSVDQVVARLKSIDIDSQVFTKTTQVVKDYWVYMPPLSGYSEAKTRVAELSLKGVDSYIFSEGVLENGLSLGVYGNRENAMRVFQKISNMGYEPKIKETMVDSTLYGVYIGIEGLRYFNDMIYESLITRYVDIKKKKVVCR